MQARAAAFLNTRPHACQACLNERHVALLHCICLPSSAQAAFLASFRERADALSAEADAQKAAHKEVRMLGAAACLGLAPCYVCSMQWLA